MSVTQIESPEKTQRESSMVTTISKLSTSLDSLSDTFHLFEERLRPILQTPGPGMEKEEAAKDRKELSPLEETIYSHQLKVNDITSALTDLLHRCCL